MFTKFSFASVLLTVLLPVNGRYLWVMTCPYIGSQYICVAWPRKHGCSRWNFVAIMYTSWYIRNFLSISGWWKHLWFTTYPYIEQHHYILLRVLWPWKRVITFEIVLPSCILADIRAITLFKFCISDFRFHVGMLLIALLKSLTPKTWSSRWNFVSTNPRSWYIPGR